MDSLNLNSYKKISLNPCFDIALDQCQQYTSGPWLEAELHSYVQGIKIGTALIFVTIVDHSNQNAATIIIMIRSQYE